MKTITEENPELFQNFFKKYFKTKDDNNLNDILVKDALYKRYNTEVNRMKSTGGGDYLEGRTMREFLQKLTVDLRNSQDFTPKQKNFLSLVLKNYQKYILKNGTTISSNEEDENKKLKKIINDENSKNVKNYSRKNGPKSGSLALTPEERYEKAKREEKRKNIESQAPEYSPKRNGIYITTESCFNY